MLALRSLQVNGHSSSLGFKQTLAFAASATSYTQTTRYRIRRPFDKSQSASYEPRLPSDPIVTDPSNFTTPDVETNPEDGITGAGSEMQLNVAYSAHGLSKILQPLTITYLELRRITPIVAGLPVPGPHPQMNDLRNPVQNQNQGVQQNIDDIRNQLQDLRDFVQEQIRDVQQNITDTGNQLRTQQAKTHILAAKPTGDPARLEIVPFPTGEDPTTMQDPLPPLINRHAVHTLGRVDRRRYCDGYHPAINVRGERDQVKEIFIAIGCRVDPE
ncbi:hypothetical protein BJ138DRAFT_1100525 [Hygrophoropsis aurantiaca]|uniref:Uncharacterized protein n=1 Tax=Hygrophoropsis aurantiaca TaxID=72124 RepID=A0ACB8AH86_9AGAM|nr:hypothetical protein BJ138DRAFT_1100525 [Hygrophoropsis aurantiaca]